MPRISFRCFELAEYFLIDEPELRDKASELAQAIQDAIEEWIDVAKSETDPL